jgi:hypothetical protein
VGQALSPASRQSSAALEEFAHVIFNTNEFLYIN